MKYFTIKELTKSPTATKLHIDNTPNQEQLKNLELLVDNILDPLREKYAHPITVTSGFRCLKLNTSIGGSKTSQHMKGQAADIKGYDNKKLFEEAKKLNFDQLIWEFGNDEQPAWIHISYNPTKNRHQILKAVKVGGKTIYKHL